MDLAKDTDLVKLELLSNATTIDSALNYIRNKQIQQREQSTIQELEPTNNELTSGKQTVY
jgi:hypothetical protein